MIEGEWIVIAVVALAASIAVYFMVREQLREEKEIKKRREEKQNKKTRLTPSVFNSEWFVEEDYEETGFEIAEERNLSDVYEDSDTLEEYNVEFEKTEPNIFIPKALMEAEPPNMASPELEKSNSFDTGGYPPSSQEEGSCKGRQCCCDKSNSWSTSGGDYQSGSLFGSGSDSGFNSSSGNDSCDD